MELQRGDRVKAAAYGGAIERRVVAVENGRVFICTDKEWTTAELEGREPISVGFRPVAVSVLESKRD